jgi:head-tail adaptor
VGSVCRVQRFRLGEKCFADDEEVETEVRKWLRHQSRDLYVAGFDALVKRWDKCINVWWRICREINAFSRLEYHMFYVSYPFVTYLPNLPRTWNLTPDLYFLSVLCMMYMKEKYAGDITHIFPCDRMFQVENRSMDSGEIVHKNCVTGVH